ncbi:hypothetical protein TEA_000222 [Camellia sinensis var. sinensis]|uniref:E2F/DP family winged-helix DNA-binding domain-containing protein n=1 Tax=Camellia sinensis var. sinensis TaxID=542762 RepID=A0A4S4E4G6_CAMSN|nr:hypothetical protein TEA_000222 [Camellia sinensis var. sinensis]
MEISDEDRNRTLEQSLSQIQLQSHSHSHSQNHRSSFPSPSNRSFPPPPSHFRRPLPFAFIPPPNDSNRSSSSSAATSTDFQTTDTSFAFSKFPISNANDHDKKGRYFVKERVLNWILLVTCVVEMGQDLNVQQTNEIGNCKAKTSRLATIEGRNEADLVNNTLLGPETCTGGKRYGKPKVARHGTQGSNADPPDGLNAVSGCRYDSSLGLLTKKFISLIQEAKDGTLDLNKTADVLEVQKRRIYDITNVLEGIGLLEKTAKNHIRLKGFGMMAPGEVDDQFTTLKAEVESLYDEEYRLDDCIREKLELLRTVECNENCQKYLYLTEEDIMSVPCFKNKTLIAIKAPRASTVEVPDPDEDISFPQRQFRLVVRSSTGPIDLYLLSKNGGQDEDVTVKQVNSTDSRSSGGGRHTNLSLDHQNNLKMAPDTLSPIGSKVSGIQKIVPSDCDVDDDYWFRPDHEVSAIDLWDHEVSAIDLWGMEYP